MIVLRLILVALMAAAPAWADTRTDIPWALSTLSRQDACVEQMFFAITPPTGAQRDRCIAAFFTCEAQFGLAPEDALPADGPVAHDLIHCFRASRQRFLTLAHSALAQWGQGVPPEDLARRLDALARVHGRTGGQCGAAHPRLGPGFWRCMERAVLNSPLLPRVSDLAPEEDQQ